MKPNAIRREPEGFPRFMMVLAGMAPLFILWAIRGIALISNFYLIPACLLLALIPNLYLCLRIRGSQVNGLQATLAIGKSEDHRTHLLAYLFTLLLPLYDANLGDCRAIAAAIAAFSFIVFLFWHLNLHYTNIFLALGGYRVFTIQLAASPLNMSGQEEPIVLITWRPYINDKDHVSAFYISRTLYFEPKPARQNEN
ncbi:MAG: hypothetical protein ABIQ57_07855 [Candidatus Kapaibacterium sp.]